MKKPIIKYTSSGCRILYKEIGTPTKNYRIELEKKDGVLYSKKIYEGDK